LGAVKVAQIKKASSQQPPMPVTSVASVEARTEAWQPTLQAIGTLAPIEGVSLSAEGDGVLAKIHVENGALVQAGDLLLELDVSVESAQLKAAEARLELARLEATRARDLLAKNTISQSALDQANAQLNQAEAEVAALQATIARKNVRAPFSGRVGIRHVN
ncbi:efflux RND transporter periplasmic adaptor subunit, partial [Klebsiella pneumoniae]|uniref:efflux RND transporter periplasmic adaptor subunit n=1 Tax=Klebsiella pneumoniae TaxID=573 RepID=UPI0021D0A8F7